MAERPQRAADVAGRVARGEPEQYVPREVKPEELAPFRFENLLGLDEQIGLIRQQIVLPLQYGSAFEIMPSKTLVPHLFLYGPPATGKTDLAMAIANATGAAMFIGAGSSLQSAYQAQSARNFSTLIAAAAYRASTSNKWAIVFMDEGDVLLASSTASGDRSSDTNITEAFKELVQFGSTVRRPVNVLIIVATNLPGRIEDEAVLSRFGLKLFIGPPHRIRVLTTLAAPFYPRTNLLLRGVNAINQKPRCGVGARPESQLLTQEALIEYVRTEDSGNQLLPEQVQDADVLYDLELALFFYTPRELDVLVNLTANLMEPTPFHLDEYRYAPSELDRKCIDVYKRATVEAMETTTGSEGTDLWVLAYPGAGPPSAARAPRTADGIRKPHRYTPGAKPKAPPPRPASAFRAGKTLLTLEDVVTSKRIGAVRWGIITAETLFRMLTETSVYPFYTRELLDRYISYANRLRDAVSRQWITDIIKVGDEPFKTRYFRSQPGLQARAPFWRQVRFKAEEPGPDGSSEEQAAAAAPPPKRRRDALEYARVSAAMGEPSLEKLVESMLSIVD